MTKWLTEGQKTEESRLGLTRPWRQAKKRDQCHSTLSQSRIIEPPVGLLIQGRLSCVEGRRISLLLPAGGLPRIQTNAHTTLNRKEGGPTVNPVCVCVCVWSSDVGAGLCVYWPVHVPNVQKSRLHQPQQLLQPHLRRVSLIWIVSINKDFDSIPTQSALITPLNRLNNFPNLYSSSDLQELSAWFRFEHWHKWD